MIVINFSSLQSLHTICISIILYLVCICVMMWEAIIFYVVVIDAVGYNLVAWFGSQWYTRHFTLFARYFPVVK